MENEKRKKIAESLLSFLKKKLSSANNILIKEVPNDSTEVTINGNLFLTVTEGAVDINSKIAPCYLTNEEREEMESLITWLFANTLRKVFITIKKILFYTYMIFLFIVLIPLGLVTVLLSVIGNFFFDYVIDPLAMGIATMILGAKTFWKDLKRGEE